MTRYVLGLDIGSNSVGSAAWILDRNEIVLGVSVFPAGVEQSDRGRGDPVGRDRRTKRMLRRMLARRAARKRAVWRVCAQAGLLPATRAEMDALLQTATKTPWQLRAEGLDRPLEAREFGRILLHIAQRRGGLGLNLPAPGSDEPAKEVESEDEQATRAAHDHTSRTMHARGARTYGELMWMLLQESRRTAHAPKGSQSTVEWRDPVRNRDNLLVDHPERAHFASRELIRSEFAALWESQRRCAGPLAAILTDDLRSELDDPTQDADWRHRGVLFGQRRTKWDLGSLGRCVLEPSDRCVPIADMHGQRFRVVETVNNLRVRAGGVERPLELEERERVLTLLSTPQLHETGRYRGTPKRTATATDIKKALGLPTRDKSVRLNYEDRDKDKDYNVDWFQRSIVHGVFGEQSWRALSPRTQESVNRAILKFDPESAQDDESFRRGAGRWWSLQPSQIDALIAAWRSRPKLEQRLNMSRHAIQNILPFMERRRRDGAWPTQIEARRAFAEDAGAMDVPTGRPATEEQRKRYFFGLRTLTHQDRRFLKKHPDLLPPAPIMTNPVVRKAIHEVRRHIVAYIRKFGCKPERIVLEFARDATQSGKTRDEILNRNRWRDKQRREVGEGPVSDAWGGELHRLSNTQRRAAVDRVLLARQQRNECPYCGQAGLTERIAALGQNCEIDHIQPYSVSGDNSMNNKVLCCTACNRAKRKRSPREWWGESFDTQAKFARALFEAHEWAKGEYFTPRDYSSKWRNFTREAAENSGFAPGQLEATAYAARAVKAYLSSAVYGEAGSSEHGGERRIYVTHGKYTAMLRRDWELFQDSTPHAEDAPTPSPTPGGPVASKNRGDHRHHAIDASVIALTTPEILPRLGALAKDAEEHFARTGTHIRRMPLPPPFGKSVEDFREQILARVFGNPSASTAAGRMGLIASHRPVRRKLIGHLHKDTLYGPVLVWNQTLKQWDRDPTKATDRLSVYNLKPAHLRVPEGWDERSAKLNDSAVSIATKAQLRRELAAMDDVQPEKTGVVRDRALRDRLRRSLREIGLDPDSFTDKQLKAKLDAGSTLTLDSGKPVRSVVRLRTNSDPIVIPRKVWDPGTRRMRHDPDPRTVRIYDSQNNHHIEIREDAKGRWTGVVVPMFEAARRVRTERRPAVDRGDDDSRGGRFVMSLSEGETVHMKHPQTGEPGYFVVFKIDKPQTVHFIHHWDSRGASERKTAEGVAIADSSREDVAVPVSRLKGLGAEEGSSPKKVRISPLGEAVPLLDD